MKKLESTLDILPCYYSLISVGIIGLINLVALIFPSISYGQHFNLHQKLGNSLSLSVALGDLDGDGDLDAFVANEELKIIKVWLNDGSGTFADSGQALGDIVHYGESLSVALGDLDGDGDLDAFVARGDRDDQVFLNNGSATFFDSGQALGDSLHKGSQSVALGDLDGDGDLDTMVTGSVFNLVWLNDGSGFFSDSGTRLQKGFFDNSVALGDLDGDGDMDAWVAYGDSCMDVPCPSGFWRNDGTGNFDEIEQFERRGPGVLGDLDSDGDLDAISNKRVLFNNGGGIFSPGQILNDEVLISAYSVALGDVDGDNDIDVLLAGRGSNRLWLNDGEGNFNRSQIVGRGLVTSHSVALGDLDGDGDLDAFVANGDRLKNDNDNANWVFLNTPMSPINLPCLPLLLIPPEPSGPAAPSNLVATAHSSSAIFLTWTDNSGNETGFIIERSLSPESGFVQIADRDANATSYNNTGLSPSTQYYYRVYAYNNTGISSYSNIDSATSY